MEKRRLIVDGNSVYELDMECVRRNRTTEDINYKTKEKDDSFQDRGENNNE